MRKAIAMMRLEHRSSMMIEPMREMDAQVEADVYFQNLEDFIDRARKHLKSIQDPVYRAEMRTLYREIIQTRLSRSLEKILKKKAP